MENQPKKISNLEKRKPKTPLKFKVELNDEQKLAKSAIYECPVVLMKGQAGSGKTLVACQAALDMFFKREVEKIVITRPTVAKEELGFLPGDMKEKMDPWLAPIYANLYMLYNKEAVDKMIAEGYIEIVPFAFMRGRTFPNTIVLVDECQNITHTQTEMMLGRLGKGGKMIFCGDLAQIDLKSR